MNCRVNYFFFVLSAIFSIRYGKDHTISYKIIFHDDTHAWTNHSQIQLHILSDKNSIGWQLERSGKSHPSENSSPSSPQPSLGYFVDDMDFTGGISKKLYWRCSQTTVVYSTWLIHTVQLLQQLRSGKIHNTNIVFIFMVTVNNLFI